MNKLVILALAAVALIGMTSFLMMHKTSGLTAYPDEVVKAFKAFCSKFHKYQAGTDPDQVVYRLGVYYSNLKKIQAHNAKPGVTYTMGENQFMDLTHSEFVKYYLGLKPQMNRELKNVHVNSGKKAANSINWNDKGDVTAVKDQGQCGSCWAFSTTGSLEANNAIFGGSLPSLSEQQLVDCSGSYGNDGCNGGLMDYAFQYVIANGITSEDNYEYTAQDGNCDSSAVAKVVAKISGYKDVSSGNCDDLTDAVNQQPISIGVDAETWQFYSGGVFSDCGDQLDHGVLAVGYDDSSNWIVKNSWGTSWGNAGYITLATGNTCGICNTASYPVL